MTQTTAQEIEISEAKDLGEIPIGSPQWGRGVKYRWVRLKSAILTIISLYLRNNAR